MKHPNGTEAFGALPHLKKERIYQAAVAEFAERGFGKASMNRLVESAGISKGSLFVYFKSKSGLFDAIIDLAVNRIKDYLREVRQSTADDPFPQRISILLRSGFRFVDQYPKLAKIYFELLQSNDAPKPLQKMVQTLNWQSTRYIASFIEDGIKRGELDSEMDTDRTAFLINALFEKLLRSYYNEHLAPEAGLYAADAIDIDNWVQSTVAFVTFGVYRFSKGEL